MAQPEPEERPGFLHRLLHKLIGRPLDVEDTSLFRHLSLIPILAWIGLGADGLSSSSYGPEEAFRALGRHTHLAVLLAFATALHGLHHLLCLLADHRAFPARRRGLHRGDPHDRTRGRRGLGLRPPRGLHAHHHRLPRILRGRHLQFPPCPAPALQDAFRHVPDPAPRDAQPAGG